MLQQLEGSLGLSSLINRKGRRKADAVFGGIVPENLRQDPLQFLLERTYISGQIANLIE